ncbi:unnamed protein product [Hymenolepis diminuta]|uniref:Coactosin-like protein n=1 Tax=Hymenolepis diminuta TaxID=6216 RepID=A0A0R3SKV8_HYMDI|nr:unnamed protein product [Hymenolepis diminuta]VUZ51747.1 unnamed protein product [Hymenolepis diminuta]
MADIILDKEGINKVYEEVRNDNEAITWMCVSEKDKKLQVTASGENFDDIGELLDDSIREYFFIRLTVGDELSKRTKFALVTWIGNNCGPLKKGLIMHEKPKIRECIQNVAVELTFSDISEFTQSAIEEAIRKAGGANYGRG